MAISWRFQRGSPWSRRLIPLLANRKTNTGRATVSISGDLHEHQTLTANFADNDPDGAASAITYQWSRGSSKIVGATNSTYLLLPADVGKKIQVTVRYTDALGNHDIAKSSLTATIVAVNDGQASEPGSTGAYIEHMLLTAVFADDDPDGPATSISYQWLRDGVEIGGATNLTYLITPEDVGSEISIRVDYVDGQGFSESVDNTGDTDIVMASNDGVSSIPFIAGVLIENETLIAFFPDNDPDGAAQSIEFQWLADGVEIDGEVTSSLFLSGSLGDKVIRIRVDYTDGQGFSESVTSLETDPIVPLETGPASDPTIDGMAQEDAILTANFLDDDPDGPTSNVTYQWFRSPNTAIPFAAAGTYTLTDDDVGHTIRVSVEYDDPLDNHQTLFSASTDVVIAANDGAASNPTISGSLVEFSEIMANFVDDDPDGPATGITYQWIQDSSTILVGETNVTHILSSDDVGHTIKVRADYTDGQGFSESVTSSSTATIDGAEGGLASNPTITGTETEGQTLTGHFADDDPDGGPTTNLLYRWIRDANTMISGQTGTTYVLQNADAGHTVKFRVSYTDGQGFNGTVFSAPTGTIVGIDSGNAAGSVTGTAQEDSTLTVVFNDNDPDGPATGVTYQWVRDTNTTLVGEVSTTYLVLDADVGHTLKCRVSYTDGQGFAEAVMTGSTSAVTAFNDGAASTPTITGTQTEGQTLTAHFADDDPDGAATGIGYQWIRDSSTSIGGATNSTYVLTNADAGHTIKVRVDYTDGQGFSESVTSASTGSIVAIDSGDATVSVSGSAQEGQTLSGTFNNDDPDGTATGISYQWIHDTNTSIGSATSSSYVLTATDVGHTVKLRVNYTDAQGFSESVFSSSTSTVTAVDSGNATVAMTGTALQGDTLTATFHDDDPDGAATGISYQWVRDTSTTIDGATSATYVLDAADVGHTVKVRVDYTDGQGFSESIFSSSTGVVNANEADSNTIVLIHANGSDASTTFTDESGRGHTVTAGGNAQVDTAQSQFGGASALLDGTGDSVNVTTAADLALGTGDFTVDFWVRLATLTGDGDFFDFRSSQNAVSPILFHTSGSGTIIYYTNGAVKITSGAALLANTWAHVALVRSSGTTKLYMGGTATGAAYTDSNNYVAPGGLKIGINFDSINSLNGWIDEFRVSNVARWTTNFTPPVAEYTSAINNGAASDPTITGTPTEGQTLTGHFADNDPDGAATAITYKWRRDDVDIGGATSITYIPVNADVGHTLKFRVSYTDGQSFSEVITSAATSSIAGIDSGDATVSVSGDAVKGVALSATFADNDPDGAATGIGYQWIRDSSTTIAGETNTTYVLADADIGHTVKVRVDYTDAQGFSESVFSSDTATVAATDAFTKLLLHGDGTDASTTITDSSSAAHTVTVGGTTQIDTAQSVFGGASILFPSSGAGLALDGSSDFAFGTGDFTIDFRFRLTSVSGVHTLYDGRNAGSAGPQPTIYCNNATINYLVNASSIAGGSVLAVNTWYHLALTRSGTSTKMFLNGAQVGSTLTDSNNYTNGAARPHIGYNGFDTSAILNGWMDEVRVSKGTARWTSNFTPPILAY